MSSFWNFAFGAILIVIWIISGGYVTQANVFLTHYKNTDEHLHRAYWFTFWAAFVTWFLIGIFIILIILSLVGVVALFGSGAGEAGVAAEGAEGAEVAEEESALSRAQKEEGGKSKKEETVPKEGISWLTIGFLIFALVLVGVTGVLAAIAASSMTQSSNFDPSVKRLKQAYDDCVIAAAMCLGAGGLLLIGLFTYFIVGIERQKKIDTAKKAVETDREEELVKIREVRQQAVRQKVEQQAEFRQQLQQAEEQALIRKVYQQAGVAPPS